MNVKFVLFLVIIVLLVGVGYFWFFQRSAEEVIVEPKLKGNMVISSPVFENQGFIPSKYTCDGSPPAGGINPPLEIKDVPQGTKSLALIMDDPDAPGGTWVHWTVWNINPKTTQIPENSVPLQALEGQTSFGKSGYGGPCPPSGTHRYFFKLYALDTTLTLSSQTDKAELEKAGEGHILDKAELIGLYSRK